MGLAEPDLWPPRTESRRPVGSCSLAYVSERFPGFIALQWHGELPCRDVGWALRKHQSAAKSSCLTGCVGDRVLGQ